MIFGFLPLKIVNIAPHAYAIRLLDGPKAPITNDHLFVDVQKSLVASLYYKIISSDSELFLSQVTVFLHAIITTVVLLYPVLVILR